MASKLETIPPLTGSGTWGPFSASYQLGFIIPTGSFAFTNSHTLKIDHIELEFNPMILTLGIDLPHIHFGGECIIPTPWGCALRLPTIDIFGANPDISIPLDLSGITSSFSGEFSVMDSKQILAAKGSLGPHKAHDTPDASNEIRNRLRTIISSAIPILPTAWVNALADDLVPLVKNGLSNELHGNLADKWQFFLRDVWHDFRLIDLGASATHILTHLLDRILDTILGGIPDIFKDIIKAILQPVINLIGAALNIVGDITDWLSSVFRTSFGLLDLIEQLVLNFFTAMVPFYQFEDPYPMIEDTSGLIPVLVPVENVTVAINNPELVISADLG